MVPHQSENEVKFEKVNPISPNRKTGRQRVSEILLHASVQGF